jgi:hypothetical protein
MNSIYENEVVEIYDLSVTRCNQIILKSNLERNGHYFNYYKKLLHGIQTFRIQAAGFQQTYFDENYCRNTLKLSEERIKDIDFEDIEAINEQFGNSKGTHVDFDHNCVSFNDSYLLDPLTHESEYFQFLCMLLCIVRPFEIKTVLSFHISKNKDSQSFISNIKVHFRSIPEQLRTIDIKDTVFEWLDLNKTMSITKKGGNKLQAPVIALFCNLVNESKLDSKGNFESIEDYCKRICLRFNLGYTNNVRINYSRRSQQTHQNKVKSLILPLIDAKERGIITNHLNNNKKMFT